MEIKFSLSTSYLFFHYNADLKQLFLSGWKCQTLSISVCFYYYVLYCSHKNSQNVIALSCIISTYKWFENVCLCIYEDSLNIIDAYGKSFLKKYLHSVIDIKRVRLKETNNFKLMKLCSLSHEWR